MKVDIDIKPGTEKMVQAGILASVILKFKEAEGGPTLIQVNDVTIRASKDDSGPWVAYPSRDSGMKDPKTGKNKYFHIVKFHPDDVNRFNGFSETILKRFAGSGSHAAASGPAKSTNTPPKAATRPEPAQSVPAASPLDGFEFG